LRHRKIDSFWKMIREVQNGDENVT
jgi:hypothetical protein